MTEKNDRTNDGTDIGGGQDVSPAEQVNDTSSGGEQPATSPAKEPAKEEAGKSVAGKQSPETKDSNGDSYGIEDLFPKDFFPTTPMGDGEKTMLSNLVKKFSDIGLSRHQAQEIFQELKSYATTTGDTTMDGKKIYAAEMAKLGDERDTILSSLRSFSDTMVANRVWDEAKKKSFYDTVTTAHTARLFYDVIANGGLVRAGNFSHASAFPASPPQFSKEEQVAMYKKAFEIARSNPSDGDLEIKRLDRLFGIK